MVTAHRSCRVLQNACCVTCDTALHNCSRDAGFEHIAASIHSECATLTRVNGGTSRAMHSGKRRGGVGLMPSPSRNSQFRRCPIDPVRGSTTPEEARLDHPMVDHVERRARLLTEMIDRLGVDRCRLARACCGEAYAAASRNCLRCPNPSSCIDFLDALSRGAAIPPHFCPNYELLRSYITKP